MDWKILETFKENKLKKQINTFYQVLHRFQKEIIADIHPQLISFKDFSALNNWWYVKKEGVHAYLLDDELCFVNASNRSNYASFLEKNVAFNRLPNSEIQILPDEILNIEIRAECSEGLTVKIAIVEYSEKEKRVTTMVNLNERRQIKLGTFTKKLRLALRFSGKGVVRFKGIKFDRIFSRKTDTPFLHNYSQTIKDFSELKVACIFDSFTMANLQNEVELITFAPENWEKILNSNRPHLLFVESAWHGNEGTWQYQVGEYSNVRRDELFNLIRWCNERNIPTIFWNKEDPIHFNKFIDTAKHFDYIFTTDRNMINEYKKITSHDNIFELPFAVNPAIHNPIRLESPRENSICFAGSYYGNRHKERQIVMDNLLDISKDYGLVIYDRNFQRTQKEFQFPERFQENIVGSLPYHEIDRAYKGYKFMLNVNSVINSPTMFSRRVFEGLASGTPILSSYSEGILEMFGNIVMISDGEHDLKQQLKKVSDNNKAYSIKSLLGIREVYEKHTYKHRLSFILKNMGIDVPVKEESVTMIVVVHTKNEIEEAINLYKSQSYNNKKLAIVISDECRTNNLGDFINNYQDEDVEVCLLSYMENYEEINKVFTTDWLAFINLKNFYGFNYLKDLLLASNYTNADFIGKKSIYRNVENKLINTRNEACEYSYVDSLYPEKTIVKNNFSFRKDAKKTIVSFLNNHNLSEYKRFGAVMFSVDCFNFIEDGSTLTEKFKREVEI